MSRKPPTPAAREKAKRKHQYTEPEPQVLTELWPIDKPLPYGDTQNDEPVFIDKKVSYRCRFIRYRPDQPLAFDIREFVQLPQQGREMFTRRAVTLISKAQVQQLIDRCQQALKVWDGMDARR
jgi:hypothetical protein